MNYRQQSTNFLVCLLYTLQIPFWFSTFSIAIPLSTPTPPPSPVTAGLPLPFTLPEEYPLYGNVLHEVGLSAVQDFWRKAMVDSAFFQSSRLHLWKAVHARRIARGSLDDSHCPSLEEDFQYCLDSLILPRHPPPYSQTQDRFLNLIRAQQAADYGHTSGYYNDTYNGGYSSLETVMSAAMEHGTALQHALQLDQLAVESIDDLMKVVKG